MSLPRPILLVTLIGCMLLAASGSASGVSADAPRPARIGPAATVGAKISYQGQLTDAAGQPLSGSHDFNFQLWNDPTAGTLLGSNIIRSGVAVTAGLFTVELDVPAEYFDGRGLWLRIGVDGGFLTPRQELLPVPYALGLRPGAVIEGDGVNPFRSLTVINKGLGTALRAQGTAVGLEAVGMTGVKGDGDVGVLGTGLVGVRGVGSTGVGVEGHTEADNATSVLGRALGQGATGVRGEANDYGGTGVAGAATFGTGVVGTGEIGVKATGTVGFGLQAEGAMGVSAKGKVGDGVNATSDGNAPAAAVRGDATDAHGGVFSSDNAAGVKVTGGGGGADKAALVAENTSSSGVAASLSNNSRNSTAYLENRGPGDVLLLRTGTGTFLRAVDAKADPKFRLEADGNAFADGAWKSGGADLAEMVAASGTVEPGDVLVIDASGGVTRSSRRFQTTVAGVHSTRPGFVGGEAADGAAADRVALAIVGIVPVKVSAENGAIRAGDLLVTSSVAGHAMRAGPNPPAGTVIGKAMGTLGRGQRSGVIRMLVTLQ